MELSKAFFINISVLFTFAYFCNMIYKYFLLRFSVRMKYGFAVAVFVVAGWFMMLFSFDIGGAKFDLRSIPLILALLVFGRPWTMLAIGAGIGLFRLSFGLDMLGISGFLTMAVTGLVAEAVSYGFRSRKHLPFWQKTVIAVLTVNLVRVILVPVFGAFSVREYFTEIFPIDFPVSLALGFLFVYIIRDFMMEQMRAEEYVRANRLLRMRTDDLRQAKQELEGKADQLKTASRYKSEFLANMSHELKTPLNTIMLLSQLQGEEETGEDDRIRYGTMIRQSGEALQALVTDILDLSKVESGKLDVSADHVWLADVGSAMNEQFRLLAAGKGLDFTVRVQESDPGWIWTDPGRLHQILRNLLGNAFKFTDKGSVSLTVEVDDSKGGAKEAVFRVSDTGVGIVREQRDAIFEAFKQEDGSISRKYGGSGLGLAISRQLAGLLGGRLEMESEKGSGSCFTLRLPVRLEQNEPDAFAHKSAAANQIRIE